MLFSDKTTTISSPTPLLKSSGLKKEFFVYYPKKHCIIFVIYFKTIYIWGWVGVKIDFGGSDTTFPEVLKQI